MQKFNEFRKLSVLYAEDEPQLRALTEETLRLVVGNVYLAANGHEALELFENHRIDVIILDIYMDGMNGLDLAKSIRSKNPKVPIAIVSGSVETSDLLEACKLNLIEYIRKPIEFNVLIKILYAAVDRLKEEGLLKAKISDTLTYDFFAKALVSTGGEPIVLTKNEIVALELLIKNRGNIIPYETFMHHLDDEMSDGALKNLIMRLRKKMGNTPNLKNLSKIGYSLT